MAKKTFIESIASSATKVSGNRWRVVLAAPGKGNNGTFGRKVLEEQGPAAFPPNTKAFIKHAAPEERDPRDQFGKYPSGAWYDANEDGHLDTETRKYPEGALVADLEVRKAFADIIDDMGDEAELSMYVTGDTDDEGNVTVLNPWRGNSVDLVAFGALEGSGVLNKIYESLHSDSIEPTDETSAVDKEKDKMDKEILDAINALKLSIDALATGPKPKTEAELQAEVDAKVEAEVGSKVDEALEGALEQIAAIDAAELLPSMAESLKADVKKGKIITESLAAAKVTMTEFKTLAESLGTSSVLVNESGKNEDWTVR